MHIFKQLYSFVWMNEISKKQQSIGIVKQLDDSWNSLRCIDFIFFNLQGNSTHFKQQTNFVFKITTNKFVLKPQMMMNMILKT